MDPVQASNATLLTPPYIFRLSVLATAGLVLMWGAFWWAVTQRGESVRGILASPGFFRTVVVMGVVAATTVLCLAGHLESNLAGAEDQEPVLRSRRRSRYPPLGKEREGTGHTLCW
jgi:hypothetical protein